MTRLIRKAFSGQATVPGMFRQSARPTPKLWQHKSSELPIGVDYNFVVKRCLCLVRQAYGSAVQACENIGSATGFRLEKLHDA